MKKIKLNKIASSTRNLALQKEVIISEKIEAKEGNVIAARVLEEKLVYNEIELVDGRMTKLCKGDIIAGVLGERRALRGFSGILPKKIKVGDKLDILNLGGVIGLCTSENLNLGPPIPVEVLGSILIFPFIDKRVGIPANITKNAIKSKDKLENGLPIIAVSGTCMNCGKTSAACEIIKIISRKGYRVGAAKLTGVSLRRDTLKMQDYGAVKTLDFTDAGVVATISRPIVPIAKGLIHELNDGETDVILIELGDGILGEYQVQRILQDKEIMSFVKVNVLATSDPVAAWGAVEQFKKYGFKIDIITGPVTDNDVGIKFVEKKLKIPAVNALRDGEKLGEFILKKVFREN